MKESDSGGWSQEGGLSDQVQEERRVMLDQVLEQMVEQEEVMESLVTMETELVTLL